MDATLKCCAQDWQERAGDQQNRVRRDTEGEREECCKKDETSWTLPKASSTTSQQTGAMGTNTWAPVQRTSIFNIRGYTHGGSRSPEYQGTDEMYGESGRLEKTTEGWSEDDLETDICLYNVDFLLLACLLYLQEIL